MKLFAICVVWLLWSLGMDHVMPLYVQTQPKLVGGGAVGNAAQGRSTCVSGDGLTAGVGGNGDSGAVGAVWFYARPNAKDYAWVPLGSKVVPSDNTGAAEFGTSCSLNFDGSVAVIGGRVDNNFTGAAWVFIRNQSGYFEQQGPKLVGSGYVTSTGCGFGQCVFQGDAISLTKLSRSVFVVSGRFDNGRGAAWVFRLNITNSSWYQVGSKLTGNGIAAGAQSGQSVAISAYGDVIALGAYNDAGGGSVYIFTLSAASSLYAQQGSKLTPSPASTGFGTGVSFSYDGGTLVVGACYDNGGIGAMFAFTRNASGFFQQQGGKNVGTGYICASNCVNQGVSISISANGKVAAIGARHDSNSIGATWIFTRNNGLWSQYGSKLVGSGNAIASTQGIEGSVSISADASMVLVGGAYDNSNIGAAWAFNDTYFTSTSCPRPADNEYVIFSQSDCLPVMVDSMFCTPLCAAGLYPSMTGKVTCRNGTLLNALNFCGGYQQTQGKLVGTGASANAWQGSSACISGDGMTAAVGGEHDSNIKGAVWFFTRNSPKSFVWTQQGSKVIPSDDNGAAVFGRSCSLNFRGDVAILGGPINDNWVGASWVFTRNITNVWSQQGGKLVGTGYTVAQPIQAIAVAVASISSNVFVTAGQAEGVAWVFSLSPSTGTWVQVGNKLPGGDYGVAIDAYGKTIALGYAYDPSISIYIWNSITMAYSQQQFPPTTAVGVTLSLSYDGNVLAVGSASDTVSSIGALFIFTRKNSVWNQQGAKYVGTGYLCFPNCGTQKGMSVAVSASGLVVALHNGYDNAGLGAVWIFTRNNTSELLNQYGTKMVVNGNVGIQNVYSYDHLNSISADGSALIVGGPADNNFVGAAWTFNNSLIPLSPCFQPNDTSLVFYSTSCTSPIISGTTCIPTCAPNFAALPEWISVDCYNGTLTAPLATCIPYPSLSSVCPEKILANVTQSVLVQGIRFSSAYNASCILISGGTFYIFAAVFLSPTTITCYPIWPNTTANQIVRLNVAHNGVLGNQQSLSISILGACEVEKAGSISGIGGCVCPRGTFDAGSSCLLCSNGEYQDEEGKAFCKPCGDNRDTNGAIGSISPNVCVCQVNYFPNPKYDTTDPKSSPCLVCVRGMTCLGNNAVLIQPGYWRANNITTAVLECPNGAKACPGTIANSTSLCADGYKGPMCTVCKLEYAKIGNECIACPKHGVNATVLVLLIFFALLMVFVLIRTASIVNKEFNPAATASASTTKGLSEVGVGTVFKVFLNYMQVLYYIGRLSANWSAGSSNFFAVIGQSTLSPNFVAVQCASTWSFYTRLLTIYFSPALVIAFLTCVYTLRHILFRKSFKETRNDLQLAVMVILYQIHPTIMIEVISSLPCQAVPGTGTSYLKADMSVNCEHISYKVYYALSLIYMIAYVFGVMIALVYRGLYHNAVTGKLFEKSASANQKYAFFIIGYNQSCYYWEAVVMTRKLVIAGLSASVNSGLQLVWGAVVITISFILTLQQQPFVSSFINRLELVSLAALYVAVLIGFHSLLNGGSGEWSLVLLVIFNGSMAVVLFSCCLVKMRTKIVELSQKLPAKYQLKDDVLQSISTFYRNSTNKEKPNEMYAM